MAHIRQSRPATEDLVRVVVSSKAQLDLVAALAAHGRVTVVLPTVLPIVLLTAHLHNTTHSTTHRHPRPHHRGTPLLLSREKGTTLLVLRAFTWKPMPESGRDCLMCAVFAREWSAPLSRRRGGAECWGPDWGFADSAQTHLRPKRPWRTCQATHFLIDPFVNHPCFLIDPFVYFLTDPFDFLIDPFVNHL